MCCCRQLLFGHVRYLHDVLMASMMSSQFPLFFFSAAHAQALLLDCMTLDNPITLAYNSAHVSKRK